MNSVFEDFGPDSSDGPEKNREKYTTGDKQRTYPLYALWIMLTTENWNDSFATDGFRDRLFEELIQEYLKANPNDNPDEVRAALLPQLKALHEKTLQTPGQIAAVRGIWNNYLTNDVPVDFYGGRPCPGGGTILGISNLAPKRRP